MIRKFEIAAQRVCGRPAETLAGGVAARSALAQYLAADYPRAREAFAEVPRPRASSPTSPSAARTGPSAMPPAPDGRDPRVDPGSADQAARRLPPSTGPHERARRMRARGTWTPAERLTQDGDETAGAKELLKQIVEKNRHDWMEPVYIAAEADYARLLKAEPKRKKKR